MFMPVAALDILTTEGGFAPAAARAIGEAIILQIKQSYENLATREQLDELRQELVALEHRMDAKIAAAIAAAKAEILRWMFIAMTGQTVVLIGLMRWLLPHGP